MISRSRKALFLVNLPRSIPRFNLSLNGEICSDSETLKNFCHNLAKTLQEGCNLPLGPCG